MNANIKKAQSKAASPEARAKAVATMKRRRAEREAAAAKEGLGPALLKHAKMVTGKPKKTGRPKKVKGIPLDMIPDAPRKKHPKKSTVKNATRQEVVLALLKYLNDE